MPQIKQQNILGGNKSWQKTQILRTKVRMPITVQTVILRTAIHRIVPRTAILRTAALRTAIPRTAIPRTAALRTAILRIATPRTALRIKHPTKAEATADNLDGTSCQMRKRA